MIPFYRPYYNHRELIAALRPGLGRREFESAFAARVGARYGVAFAYGRSVMLAALKALELSDAEVILPAYTCLAMARAVAASGNRPAFADIDLADYNMDVEALKRALTPRTRVVVATHMYGYPADVDAIRAAVGDERVTIVEDSALGLLTFSPGTNGLCGDLGLYSFGPGKPLSTVQGGMLVTNSLDLYEKIKAYRDSAVRHMPVKAVAKRWARLLAGYVVFTRWAYGLWHRAKPSGDARLHADPLPATLPADAVMAYTDFQARIGLEQLRKLDSMAAQRRALVEIYDRELRGVPGVSAAPRVKGATYSHYTLRVVGRDQSGFRQHMARRGVAVDQSFDYALPQLDTYRPFARGSYPHAAQAADEVVNLPCYPGLSDVAARHIAASVREYGVRSDRVANSAGVAPR